MILTVTLNPAMDKTVEIENFQIGAVNRISSMRLDAGGKGINVSKTIKSLGGDTKAIGLLGGRTGSFIKNDLDRLGITNEFYFVQGETRTNLKIVDSHKKTTTDINEPGPKITLEDMEKVEEILINNIDRNTIAVFSGSIPAQGENGIYGKWIKAVKRAGGRAILDAEGELLRQGIMEGPCLVKPNLHELEGLLNKKIESIQQAESQGRSLIEQYGIEMMVVSLGEKGAIFINRHQSVLVHALKVDVKSTVGAGDSMVAALAYCMDKGYDFEKAAKLSVASGVASVMTQGTQASSLEKIQELERQIKFEVIQF